MWKLNSMIELYTFATPNGRKVSIMLEELGIPYNVHKINIRTGEQRTPEFLAINPNGKIPAITDSETGISVFESGAILIYLAEKFGQFIPTDTKGRYQVIEWVMFHMANQGPMQSQLFYFQRFAPEKLPFAIERYEKESLRIYGVLDKQLGDKEFICGEYSIADMAVYPWVAIHDFQGLSLDEFANLKRWMDTVGQRPGVEKGMKVPE